MNNCNICTATTSTSTKEIVAQLAGNKELVSELVRIHNYEYTPDIINDIWLDMLQKDKNKELIQLCQTNRMKFYLIRIFMNLTKSTTSPAAKKYVNKPNYRKNSKTYWPESTIMDILGNNEDKYKYFDLEKFNKMVVKELSQMYLNSAKDRYDADIFLLVVNNPDKSYEQLQEQVKIAHYNIGRSYRATCDKLKDKLHQYDFTL